MARPVYHTRQSFTPLFHLRRDRPILRLARVVPASENDVLVVLPRRRLDDDPRLAPPGPRVAAARPGAPDRRRAWSLRSGNSWAAGDARATRRAVDARAPDAALPRARTGRVLRLLRLGGADPSEPLSRSASGSATAFRMDLLPTEEGARILPEDARPLARKVEQSTGRRPFILANMIRLGLGKYAISKSAPDVAEVVRNQADVELSRLVSGMATVHYLAWAIPAIGFVGTVRGLGGAFGAGRRRPSRPFTAQAKDQLKIAFDCTLVALVLESRAHVLAEHGPASGGDAGRRRPGVLPGAPAAAALRSEPTESVSI